MKPWWNKVWVLGWAAIIIIAVVYELTGYWLQIQGNYCCPPFSNVLVGTLGARVLIPVTLVIAAWLVFHLPQVEQDGKAVDEIETKEQNNAALIELEELMDKDPDKDSADGKRLEKLSEAIEKFEEKEYGHMFN